MEISIRVNIDPNKVSYPGPETVILERLMKDHAFVQSAVVLRSSGYIRGHLIPDETTRRTK